MSDDESKKSVVPFPRRRKTSPPSVLRRPEPRWVAGGLALVVAGWLWFRIVVPATWGAKFTGAPIAAIALMILGAAGLVYLTIALVLAIWSDLSKDDTEDDGHGG